MFLSRNKKNNIYPFKPEFYNIKVGFKGVGMCSGLVLCLKSGTSSSSTHLGINFSLLINMKMPTIVGIFIFICKENVMLIYV